MAIDNNVPAPIVKKIKKVTGGGHHGGAWKVAYADFVTAMMAFFLLMWLLNATTESQRKGIADYFAPSIPVSRVSGGGEGVLGGDSVFSKDDLASNGKGSSDKKYQSPKSGKSNETVEPGSAVEKPSESELDEVKNQLKAMSGESNAADDLLSHIRTRVTDEGLIIEIFAREGKPLFELGSQAPTERMDQLLAMVGEVIQLTRNPIAVSGHTDSLPFSSTDFDNWDLSLDRANESRRALTRAGVDIGRFARITGKADSDPALKDAPEDPRNRRITLTLLRTDTTASDKASNN
ncbi:MAG: flagellar motor protein MotB [Pseudomonadota bacterium]